MITANARSTLRLLNIVQLRGLYPAILQFIDLTARLDPPHGIGDSELCELKTKLFLFVQQKEMV